MGMKLMEKQHLTCFSSMEFLIIIEFLIFLGKKVEAKQTENLFS